MKTITATNVNNAFQDALWYLHVAGKEENSRNGPVVVSPGPVLVEYQLPRERILWHPIRDCNPFFHLMESLWMLAGRDDVAYVEQFNSRMREYAEDDGRIHGAYGMRWRHAWGMDQLKTTIEMLRRDPTTRRAVMGMWYPTTDLNASYKDLPCNTHIYFAVKGDQLNMTVCNRSNDLLWGMCGANAVHFSFLQEFIADALGLSVGSYYHFTNNMHLYLNVDMAKHFLLNPPLDAFDMYKGNQERKPYESITTQQTWGTFLNDLPAFFERKYLMMESEFLMLVAMPMQEFYLQRKEGTVNVEILHNMPECDWKHAALDWAFRHVKTPPGQFDWPTAATVQGHA